MQKRVSARATEDISTEKHKEIERHEEALKMQVIETHAAMYGMECCGLWVESRLNYTTEPSCVLEYSSLLEGRMPCISARSIALFAPVHK